MFTHAKLKERKPRKWKRMHEKQPRKKQVKIVHPKQTHTKNNLPPKHNLT